MMKQLLSLFIALLLPASFLAAGCSSESGAERPQNAQAQEQEGLPKMTVYKSPTCGCCKDWVQHMREAGFTVETMDMQDVTPMKDRLGVPDKLHACHTAFVDGEVVEGHVPASVVKRYLKNDSAKAAGLAVPGMPVGSPGMEVPGREAQSYQVIAFTNDGRAGVYAQR